MPRSYSQRDLKLLWGLSAGRCAFPGCYIECIHPETKNDRHAIIGKVAHIQAHSDDGPRVNPGLTVEERDSYNNLILLCSNCHDLVDQQPNTYTALDLRLWKDELENRVRESLRANMLNVTFVELEFITRVIISNPLDYGGNLTVTPPKDKMDKNGLTNNVNKHLIIGLILNQEISEYIKRTAQLQPDFPERLRAGFIEEYLRLKNEQGLEGDSLFLALHEFASLGNSDFLRRAAGLGVLTYLFTLCEVFEP